MRSLGVVAIAAGLIALLAWLPIGPTEWQVIRWAFYIPIILVGVQYGSVAGLLGGVGTSLLCAFEVIARGIEGVSGIGLFAPDFAVIGFLGGRMQAGQPRSILLQSARGGNSAPESASLPDVDLNPLISIESSAKLLGEEDTPPHLREELVEIISKECQHLTASISSMVQRISESAPLQVCEVNIRSIIDAAMREAAFVLCGRGVVLRKEVAPDLPPVHCNPDQIRKLFMSLIINAAQSAPAGAEVVLRAYQSEEGVILDVRDQGQVSLARRFADLLAGPRAGMTSESLTVAYDIVRNHGGTIEGKLTVRKGMEFSVWLPKHHDDPHGERSGVGSGGR